MKINAVTAKAKPMLCAMEMQPTLIEEIRVIQATDQQLERINEEVLSGNAPGFVIHADGSVRFHNLMCAPTVEDLKKNILDEGYNTPHSVHPGGNKLYKEMNQTCWWSNMKQEIVDYVAKCLTCQRVKMEHQRPGELLQLLEIPEWKSDSMSMDFVVRLPLT